MVLIGSPIYFYFVSYFDSLITLLAFQLNFLFYSFGTK